MLHLHFANRLESLADALLARLDRPREGAAALFQPDTVIVPNAALQRHLTLAIARSQGVCAQVKFGYLSPWLWQQVGRLLPGLPQASPLAADTLAWRLYAAFGEGGFVAQHPRLAHYLGSADAVMRLELAQAVAGLVEQYSTYRPDWLAAWCAGRPVVPGTPVDEAWQAALVRRVVQQFVQGGVQARAQAHPQGPGHPDTPAGASTLADGETAAMALATATARLARLDDAALHALAKPAGLPAEVHLLALPAMPPLHLALLQQLARVMDVHIGALNPSAAYWFDVVDPRRLAYLAARGQAQHHEVGHPLLASWGRQAQAQLGLLVDADTGSGTDNLVEDADFTVHPGGHLLAQLHNSVLALVDPAPGTLTLAAGDRSIELHVCHGRVRELEVLHDRLLTLLAGPQPPSLDQILIVMPDLEGTTPLVDAVFGTAPPGRFIPYTVTGRTLASVNAPARALMDVLALAASRLPASALLALLQQPVVARRFGLDTAALDHLQDWLHDSGVHWALDADHAHRLGLPADGGHSLADGLARLFLGHALPGMGPGQGASAGTALAGAAPASGGGLLLNLPFNGLLPVGDAEGSAALDLGALWRIGQALARLQAAAAQPQSPAGWRKLLADTLADWVAPADAEREAHRELQQALQTLADQWHDAGLADAPLPLEVVRVALQALLDDAVRGGVPTGAVTFSSLNSLRGLPYPVLAVIGLDGGAFPATPRPPEFDLLAAAPRRGDRQRQNDDRNLFLDLVLAAREVLHLSCTGRSARDNSALPPSVLVDELLDWLEPRVAGGARARLVVQHPLQAFAEVAFRQDADPRQRSHREDLAEALRLAARARASSAQTNSTPTLLADSTNSTNSTGGTDSTENADSLDSSTQGDDDPLLPRTDAPPFFAQPLAPPGPEWRQVSLAQWLAFFRHPARFLLRQRLGLVLTTPDEALQDDEPFLPTGLSRLAMAERLLPALLAGAPAEAVRDLARAGTELPSGPFGEAVLDTELAALHRHAAAVRTATAAPPVPVVSLDLVLDLPLHAQDGGPPWRLQAALTELRPAGQLRHRFATTRAADLLDAWLHHLVLCAAAPAGVALETTWLGRDGAHHLRPCSDAPAQLANLMGLYAQGLRQPLAFFPQTAWAYVDGGDDLRAALAAWLPTAHRPYAEGADAWVRLAWRGQPDPLGADPRPGADPAGGLTHFHATAHAVFDALRDHLLPADAAPQPTPQGAPRGAPPDAPRDAPRDAPPQVQTPPP